MPRLLRGKSVHVPAIATAPVDDDHGAQTIALADTTASFGHVRPEVTALWVELIGSGTLELAAWVRTKTDEDGDLGWSLLYDTGNPGLLGGGPLQAPGVYTFLVSYAMIFEEIILVAQSVVDSANVELAILIGYAENVLSR